MTPGRNARRRSARPADRLAITQRPPRTQPPVGVDSGETSGSARALVLVFLVALAIRLIHLWQLRGAPFFVHLMGDSRAYDEWAQQLAAGDWLGTGVFYQAPLYPYVIGTLYALFGRDLLFVRLVQAVLGAGSCALVAAAGMEWFGRRRGILSGLLLAAYAPAIFFDALIQKSVLDGLLVAALLLALAVRANSGVGRPLISGVLLGLLVLSRENAIALLPVVVMTVWARSHRRLPAALIAVAATALVLAPVAIRNLAVGGEFHLTTSQLGPNFYIGNSASANGKYVRLMADRGSFLFERQDATDIAETSLGRRLRPSEVSNYWLGRGVDWIRSDPGAWVRLTGRKLLLLVNGTEAADTEDIATHAEWSVPLRVSARLLHFGIVAPLAFLGMWITRRRWRELWPLHALLGVFALSVIAFYVMDRYRYPLVPVLMLFAGVGLDEVVSYWKTHPGLERVKTVSLFVLALVVCNLPLQSSSDMQAVTHYNIGVVLDVAGLDSQAEAEYRTAVALQPALAGPHINLAGLLGRRGEQAEALREGREAVRLNPESPSAHVNLGVALASLGKTDDAVVNLTRALELDPRNADAHYNLAAAFRARGQAQTAMDHLRETIRLQPSRWQAYNDLGALLCSEGHLTQGIEQLRTAVKLAPASREAAANLEHALQLARQPQ
jgi:Flp pilus assembly protein TadD/4-amino-4-deoxy-L-arabinose transferase-like glycosyltransferase